MWMQQQRFPKNARSPKSISAFLIYFGFYGDTIYPFDRSLEGTVSLRVYISSLTKFWTGRWRPPHHRQKWLPWCSPHQPPAGGGEYKYLIWLKVKQLVFAMKFLRLYIGFYSFHHQHKKQIIFTHQTTCRQPMIFDARYPLYFPSSQNTFIFYTY